MAIKFWNGLGGTGFWDTSTNWVGGGAPTSGDVTLDNSFLAGPYTVQIRPGVSYVLSNLTVSGASAASVVTLVDGGKLSFTSQLKLNNAVLTINAGLVGSGSGATSLLAGNATVNLNSTFSEAGQFVTSGAGNAVNESAGSFLGSTANFGSALAWSLAKGSVVSFFGQIAGPVNFIFADATSDTLNLGFTQGNQFTGAITGFENKNVIDMRGVVFSGGTFTAKLVGAGLEIDRNTQPALTFSKFSFGAGFGIANLAYSSDSTGGTRLTVCFTAGTRILTPHGEVEIETLRPGETVIVLEAAKPVARAIRFVGRRRINLSVHPEPRAVAPVRIRAGAIADRVPHRDLIVSPDHAMLLDDVLIPARLLINHMTIVQELDRDRVQYFHIELDRHAILVAEGAAAESYLDQGNRGFFEGVAEPLQLHPDLRRDAATGETCAPLVVEGNAVFAAWSALAERARALGHMSASVPATAEADLQLFADGARLRPISRQDGRLRFILPAGAGELRLLSRHAYPSALQPWLDDRRRLGVCVHRIAVRMASDRIAIPLDDPALAQGWWVVEARDGGLWRWTDGDARVRLPYLADPAILELQVEGQAAYPLDPALPARLAA